MSSAPIHGKDAEQLSERYPAHIVAAWLGHSVEVGAKLYMPVTDEHFAFPDFGACG